MKKRKETTNRLEHKMEQSQNVRNVQEENRILRQLLLKKDKEIAALKASSVTAITNNSCFTTSTTSNISTHKPKPKPKAEKKRSEPSQQLNAQKPPYDTNKYPNIGSFSQESWDRWVIESLSKGLCPYR